MRLVRQFLVYGVSGALSRLAAIVLVPLYTRALSMEDYGQLEVLLALHALAVLLVGMQSESAVARDYFEARESGSLGRLAWSSVAITMAGTCLLLLAIGAGSLLGWLPEDLAEYVPWLLAMTIPAQLLGIQLVFLRFAGKPVVFATLSFLDLALSAAFSAILILGFGLGVTGALAGVALGKVTCMLLAWPRTFGMPVDVRQSPTMIRGMLAYALPTMPAVLLNWLQTIGSRVLLAIFLTLTDVALASIAIKVAALYGFLIYAFRLVWEPYSFERLHAAGADSLTFNQALRLYFVLMLFVAGVATLVSPVLVAILAPPVYDSATALTGFFILGQFWTGAIAILAIGIHGARITSRLTYVYGIGAVLNVLLLMLLSGIIGVTAAAVGFLLSSIASALLAAYFSEKHFRTGFDRRLIAMGVGGTAVFLTFWYLLETFGVYAGPATGQRIAAYGGTLALLAAVVSVIGLVGLNAATALTLRTNLKNFLKPRISK